MCTVILSTNPGHPWPLFIAANRDERLDRRWEPPGRHWPEHPEVVGGLDSLGGGTWLAVSDRGVAAGVLNRVGSLGPAPGKRSRGELPLIALAEPDAESAMRAVTALDAGRWRSFNMVVADRERAYYIRGLGYGHPEAALLEPGTHMIATAEPDDMTIPRIARHLPRFQSAALPQPPDWRSWTALLADRSLPAGSELNIPPRSGFGTTSSSVLALPADPTEAPQWVFSSGAPDRHPFNAVPMNSMEIAAA
ncbi:NRDE family protein [Rhizosaccharibacter radicis]|uniref:NRDE family protein n=1 Tax=Rhizosaccharibacter radicis TaxID=2782605 RepID=A0ABT1VXU9_9PROT|nr:NRDE family protein [Acetobacteraceae bacterium KSS12]